jgi:redox-sensitive bicupin YhaK (pirin superfamily)
MVEIPECGNYSDAMIPIPGKSHDLGGGFFVTRVLPQAGRRSIGPFVFFDYFGPVDFPPGKGIDVRPHPHIGLATVTYLFEGAQIHRDSLGSVQEIRPGDVNWMTAGRGIVHSERTGADMRAGGHRMHGIQSWIGLPLADEEAPPGFQHFAAAALPEREEKDVRLRLIAGTGFGLTSPVKTFSPILYADARFAAGGSLTIAPEHEELAFFVVEGEVESGGDLHGADRHKAGAMLLLYREEEVTLFAPGPARVMVLGGAKLDGERHVWWNFVASDRARIERAKQEWRDMRFGTIPGDDREFIPLPE